jgi:hypothetical protein
MALCCQVHVPQSPPSTVCPSACVDDPQSCKNGGLPLDLESGPPESGSRARLRRRDLTLHVLEKRRSSSFSQKIKSLVNRTRQTLRRYFSRGRYFADGGQGVLQGLYRQADPPSAQSDPDLRPNVDPCTGGSRLVFEGMTAQSQLTQNVIDVYGPETEHPIDVSSVGHQRNSSNS